MKRGGFTLIELLVVIAVIAILAGILFPVFASVREKARQTSCVSNEKQLGLAWTMYSDDYDETSPNPASFGRIYVAAGKALPSRSDDMYFQDLIQPYLNDRNVLFCPSVGRNLVWEPLFSPPYNMDYNGTSYWYNWNYWNGEALGRPQEPTISPICADMPDGPSDSNLPHTEAIDVVYADGHVRAAHLSASELPDSGGKSWYDLHDDDGQ